MSDATIKMAHEVLDGFDVPRDHDLIQRLRLLRNQRDEARAVVQAMWGVMETELARNMCPDWLLARKTAKLPKSKDTQ